MRNKIVLFDIDYTIFNSDKFKASGLKTYEVYEEDEDALERLSHFADLGIFSQGESAFQRAKLHETKMQRFFNEDDIHIHVDKAQAIKDILEKYKGREIIFVDDKLDILAQIKAIASGVLTVWVKRGIFAMGESNKLNFNPDKTVNNLSDLPHILSP